MKNRITLFVIAGLIFISFSGLMAQQGNSHEGHNHSQKKSQETSEQVAVGEVFKRVEDMPRFPGCDDLPTNAEKDKCAQKLLLEYLYNNLSYPESAREKGIEGLVVVQFIVTIEGYIEDVKIVRDIGEGCGAAALKVMESMNDMEQRWRPGHQRGEAVKVQFTVPVRFKLESGNKEKTEKTEKIEKSESVSVTETFKRVENMPHFPGCEDMTVKEKKQKCAQELLLAYVYENIEYPELAREKEVEGLVVLQFVVSKDGSLQNIRVIRDIGAGCGAAAMKVIESMNHMEERWIPGMQRGKTVNVEFTFPVRFKLNSDKEKNKKKA